MALGREREKKQRKVVKFWKAEYRSILHCMVMWSLCLCLYFYPQYFSIKFIYPFCNYLFYFSSALGISSCLVPSFYIYLVILFSLPCFQIQLICLLFFFSCFHSMVIMNKYFFRLKWYLMCGSPVTLGNESKIALESATKIKCMDYWFVLFAQ